MKPNQNVKAKIIIGRILIISNAIIFLLCCFPNFLNIGRFFQGVFGVLIYPLALLLILVGMANALNKKFVMDKKQLVFLIMSVVFVFAFIHTAISTSYLKVNKEITGLGAYVSYCYHMSSGITMGGIFMGIIVYVLSSLISLGATYVVFSIMSVVSIGLLVDHIIYMKKHPELKTKVVSTSEEISMSQSNTTEGAFSFSKDDDYKSVFSFEQPNSEVINDNNESAVSSIVFEPQEVKNTDFAPMFETTDDKTEKMLESDENLNFSFNKEDEKRSHARNLLFGTNNEQQENQIKEQNIPETNEPRSARDILFGQPRVPNIFDRDSSERDAWRKQYSSQPLEFNENVINQDNNEEEFKQEEKIDDNDDQAITTSWGTYKPTERINRTQNVQPTIDNIRENRISQTRSLRRDTISNVNRMSKDDIKDDEIEFGTKLSSPERRRNAGDLLADASSLGIEVKPTNDETPSFASILDQTRKEKEADQKKEEKVKVEKISFESQLNRKYNAPPTTLLNIIKEDNVDYSVEYKQKASIIENTLETFKIPAKVINVVRGPKVTRYELQMPAGIPVTTVLRYDKDLAMNLAAKNGIRIEAPIPGKNAFGVEVPNDTCSTVGLRELVESSEFQNCKNPLAIAVGKNISGEIIVKSLAKMVHCLVAGSTGSGKSVFLHSAIMSLMYKYSPDELRFIMIDPKRVEFFRYNRMPHLMLPEVVSDFQKATNSLNWAVKEMERRYELMKENGCNKIENYNQCRAVKSGENKKLPYLVIVVDELAELMSGPAKKDVENRIQRITQLGRAAGIHMIVATQRPSVDVVTGVIKNNMPTRIAFALSSAVDSRTVLDEIGAEKLLGQGDMLYSGQDSNQKIRLQAAYVNDNEIDKTLDYIKEHNISEYDEDIQKEIYAEPQKAEMVDNDDDGESSDDKMDSLMPKALKLVMTNGKASISMIQRRFGVGYARGARIIDQMETHGFIAQGIGNKPRDVLITVEQYNELFGNFDEN